MSSIPPDEATAITEIIHKLREVCLLLDAWLTIHTVVVPAINANQEQTLFMPQPRRNTDETVS